MSDCSKLTRMCYTEVGTTKIRHFRTLEYFLTGLYRNELDTNDTLHVILSRHSHKAILALLRFIPISRRPK